MYAFSQNMENSYYGYFTTMNPVSSFCIMHAYVNTLALWKFDENSPMEIRTILKHAKIQIL